MTAPTEALSASLDSRIQQLSERQAIFCLRILLVAGHVTNSWMEKAITLSEEIPYA